MHLQALWFSWGGSRFEGNTDVKKLRCKYPVEMAGMVENQTECIEPHQPTERRRNEQIQHLAMDRAHSAEGSVCVCVCVCVCVVGLVLQWRHLAGVHVYVITCTYTHTHVHTYCCSYSARGNESDSTMVSISSWQRRGWSSAPLRVRKLS
jgi:hypothetical protein